MPEQDLYEILGVAKTATPDELKRAYRALAKKLHPDLNPGNKKVERQFKDVAAAYETLSDAKKRAEYDNRGRNPFGGEGAGPQHGPRGFYYQTQGAPGGGRYSQAFDDDLLRSMFEQMGAGGRAGGRRARGAANDDMSFPGQDVTYEMEVEFRDAALGAEREITLPNGKRLRVKIPPGVESGARLRFSGHGGPGIGAGPAGDAFVLLNVKPSPTFKRAGHDLEIDLPVSFSEALLGGEARVSTLEGQVLLKIPAGVSTGARLRIRGKGAVDRATGQRGDEFAVVKIVMPREINDELREAVRKWSETHPFNPREENPHAA